MGHAILKQLANVPAHRDAPVSTLLSGCVPQLHRDLNQIPVIHHTW